MLLCLAGEPESMFRCVNQCADCFSNNGIRPRTLASMLVLGLGYRNPMYGM